MRQRSSLFGGLLVAFCVTAVLVGTAAVADYAAVTRQNSSAKQVTGRYTELQQTENALENDFGTAYFAVLYFAATGDRSFMSPFGPARAGFYTDLGNLRHLAVPAQRKLINDQDRAGGAWFRLAPEIVAARPRSPAARALLAKSSTLGTNFLATNIAAQQRLHDGISGLTSDSSQALERALVWSSVALGVAVLLVLLASLSTLYTVTQPLRRLTGTVGRLIAGDHAARAPVTGSAEVREVAQSVNMLAAESDRLREQEEESTRLRAMAREVGLRIREHLAAGDVLEVAQRELERNLGADTVTLWPLEGDHLGPRAGSDPGRPSAADRAVRQVPGHSLERLRELFLEQSGLVIQDINAEVGEREAGMLTQGVLDVLRRAGVVSLLVIPFGAETEPLGIIVAERQGPAGPWTPAEVDAVESIAADLGRGLKNARLYEAENRLVEDLRGLDRVKSDFFATVSHELRAPLTTIEGYVEMLGDGEAGEITPQQGKMLETIARSSVRLRNLVEDLFTLSKLESGGLRPVMGPVNVAEAIAGVVDAVRPSVDAGRLDLACTSPGEGIVVEGDAGQIDQVLINLLSNAVKFTPEGGHIRVTASAGNGSALISVTDTGIGIPERDQKELFSRFARASNATARRIPGTGLGLVIVRTIVVNHGGEVWLESAEGSGTTVTVRLPLLATADNLPQPVG